MKNTVGKEIKVISLESMETKPEYRIFVDCADAPPQYGLFRIIDNEWWELLNTSIQDVQDKEEFEKQIENLSSYFNAKVYYKVEDGFTGKILLD